MYNNKLHFHFIGIGGTGMSGLAQILLNLGYKVSGSDLKPSSVCAQLAKLGAEIHFGHNAENIPDGASLVVYSSAVTQDNPEVLSAHQRKLPVIRRAEVLAELMRLKYAVGVAGSHGKTTTTSMTGAILEQAGLDPTIIIGGIVKSFGSGGRLGKGNYLVAETDESDRSFLLLKPTIAVVTNIDAEHMNAYSSLEDLERSFQQYLEAVPFYGLAVLCIDDPKVRALAGKLTRRVVTYGFSPDADLQAINIEQDKNLTSYDLQINGKVLGRIYLPLPGKHLALNSLASVAVGLEFGIDISQIITALNKFTGVNRRLEIIHEEAGITVIDDYAHHPTEIKASINAVKEGWIKSQNKSSTLHVVFQPHRYTRTRDCFADYLGAFDNADQVYITDIYPASEEPIAGITSEILCSRMTHKGLNYLENLNLVGPSLKQKLKAGDVVLFMGAGTISAYAHEFIKTLTADAIPLVKEASLGLGNLVH